MEEGLDGIVDGDGDRDRDVDVDDGLVKAKVVAFCKRNPLLPSSSSFGLKNLLFSTEEVVLLKYRERKSNKYHLTSNMETHTYIHTYTIYTDSLTVIPPFRQFPWHVNREPM